MSLSIAMIAAGVFVIAAIIWSTSPVSGVWVLGMIAALTVLVIGGVHLMTRRRRIVR